MPVMAPPPTEPKAYHGFAYGKSRTGKTTLAIHFHKAGFPLLVVTREQGPARAALAAAGITDVPVIVPATPAELFVILDHFHPYLDKHANGYRPGLALFDNIRGLQELMIGDAPQREEEIAGIKVPARKATGIMQLPNSRDAGAPGLPVLKDYKVLSSLTMRFVTGVDNLPCSTMITAHEDVGYDAHTRLETAGMTPQMAAGRARRIKGFPSLEGFQVKDALPGLISDFFLRLHVADGRFKMQTDEVDDWFANARGLRPLPAEIDWTGKSGYDILVGGGKQ